MKSTLGTFLLALGGAASALGIASVALGLRTDEARWRRAGQRYVHLVLAAAVGAVAVMEWALLTHDFSIRYVAENVARATPTLYTVTALWGALEGSILLWALMLGVYLSLTVWRFRARADDPLVGWATITGLAVALFFFGLMFFAANPFSEIGGRVPLDGAGPNPLLQNHPLMAFHPPMLYAGYVGFTVPFMFAIAALATGRFGEGWLADVRRTTLVAWGFLTVGIGLGAWWSYEVLGWGGYWAWDPVENASFLPWLTGTAFLHSVMVQERRGMLRVWNLSLVLATFSLTILGTFLTRSGVIDSVHAFTESSIGPSLLAFLGVVTLTGIGLIAWRGDALRTRGTIDAPVSRESAFLVNNLLFAGFALVVLMGTVFPLLAEALQDRRISVGEPYFESMSVPIGIALLFLMAVAPMLPWRAASSDVLRDRLLVPAWIGVGTMVVALVLGAEGVAQVCTFGLGAFAAAGIARQVFVATRSRRQTASEGWPVAFARAMRGNPRLYGGLLVHLGVVVVAVALAASAGYLEKREVRLARNESTEVSGYRVTFLEIVREETDQKTTTKARIAVERDGSDLGVYAPSISTFPNATTGIGTPSVRTGLLEDLYLTLVSSPTEEGRITLGVAVNPMVLWLWIGVAVMALGALGAMVPARRTGHALVVDDDPAPPDDVREPVGVR
ncbi:MAG TPA: heme lyase CcmF/NrfE family subunit [Acidimicrobiia bacterium]|nr:heme lyase CcmF/NrfE family subunit [Acidimicrobiia bacterium]